MSTRPFSKYVAKPAFAEFNEPLDASDYITNKKAKYSFCTPNYCHPNKNYGSQSNFLTLKRANNLFFYPCKNSLDKTQLYINLLTKLQLNNVIPVADLANNPVVIDPTLTPYLTYNIDPSGNLFGNTTCGINNWENYIVYNKPYKTADPGSIDNL